MEIKPVTDTDRLNGTYLQGRINTTYAELVTVFGPPNGSTDGYKVDANWELEIDGQVTTIYNYKDGKNYMGAEGLATDQITDWHIGGLDRRARDGVYAAMTPKFEVGDKVCNKNISSERGVVAATHEDGGPIIRNRKFMVRVAWERGTEFECDPFHLRKVETGS